MTSMVRRPHFWLGLPVPERGRGIQSAWQRAWQRAAKAWPSREERAARNTGPQLFLLQPVPRGAGPRQLGAEAHALPCRAAETTQNIPPCAVGSKRNMTNRAAMRRNYCPNLYWNPFSNQANNSNTPGRLKNTVCILMKSKGSFTMKSNKQMRRSHFVRKRPTGEKTEIPFPSQLFSRLGFCSKSCNSLGFEGGELPRGR